VRVMQRKGADGLVYLDFFFLAEHWEGEVQNGEPSKCDDLRWFPLTALPRNTIPHVREVLEILQIQTPGFNEYGWGRRHGA
jgi:8-oxo-dGTP diphosphatase